MSERLPRLRGGLDVVPSPVPDRPGLILRDPYRYSEDTLLIPASWVPALSCLDGNHTELDMQAILVRGSGGQLVFSQEVQEFVSTLRSHGFLDTEEFRELRDRRHAEFRASRERQASHAGGAYPEDASRLRSAFDRFFKDSGSAPRREAGGLIGLAAPHVSPEGGWRAYVAAYGNVDPSLGEKTFVILGTSHYGEPEKFGLTAKPFVTPLGTAQIDGEGVEFLARRAPGAVIMEDYCHAIEHSIEFQVVFLQHRLGGTVNILPILCGPFAESLQSGQPPEAVESVGEFFDVLAELQRDRGGSLFWVLGIDLAHVGNRYGDPIAARAKQGPMVEVETQDRLRLERACDVDLTGLYDMVRGNGDSLKWCGFPPLYTFLASTSKVTRIKGRVLRYEQWNIDARSVVSFAGLEFFEV